MALSRALIILVAVITIFSTIAVAEVFIVGDDYGWTTFFDYQAWAANKVFRVGDQIVFNYLPGEDNVVGVNAIDFINCSVPPNAPVLSSGNDEIIFGSTGGRWYISSVGNHCKLGQKLALTVLPPEEPWSPPMPSLSPSPEPPIAPEPTAPAPCNGAPAPSHEPPFVPSPPAPAPWIDAPVPSPEPPFAPSLPPAPAPWTDAPAPSFT